MLRVLATVALVVLAGACARSYPPPGGEQDRTPPRLTGVTPEALAVVPDYAGPVVFEFDERLSERGFTESLVVVSPLDGALRVDRGRRNITVRIDGGWRPNRVYRVIVLPGLRDLFGNQRVDQAEVVFSTGPPVSNTAIAGIVQDRITGNAAQNAIVTAVRRADTVSYMALADSGGFFALRHLPLGVYEMRAFSDQNRNRRRDFAEPVDSGRVVSLTADTIVELFNVLSPDTSAPQLRSAEAIDSLHVRITFDDYLVPDSAVTDLQIQILALPDSTPYGAVEAVLHPTMSERLRRAAAPDTVVRDSTVADTTVRRPPVRPPPVRPPPAPTREGPLLPSRDLVVRLTTPLRPGGQYVIRVTNVANLSGLRGGGTARFDVRVAPAPGRLPPHPHPR